METTRFQTAAETLSEMRFPLQLWTGAEISFAMTVIDEPISHSYLQGVIVVLSDLLVLLLQVLKVFLPHGLIQELRALDKKGNRGTPSDFWESNRGTLTASESSLAATYQPFIYTW